MGKYFKEEETSNRIKRFKTSDTQEKTLRFAQVSRVTTLLDNMLDFAKTKLFRIFLKAPALLKVRDKIKEDLKDALIAIIRANISAVSETKKTMQPILDDINKAKTRQEELKKTIAFKNAKERNEVIAEQERIKRFLLAKDKELQPLNEKLAGIETSTKAEINAKIEEFNRVNDLTSPISWNQDLANPKIEFLLGVPVSKRGTGVVMDRARQKQQINIFNFLNQFRRSAGRAAFDGILTERYTTLLESIGFFDKKYKFKALEGDEWVDKKYSMGDLFEEINKGGFNRTTQKPINDEVKAKIIADFKKFEEESDKIERGFLSPIVRAIISSLILLSPYIIKNIATIATSPLRVKKQQDLKNPKKRQQDTAQARENLSLSKQEEKTLRELESILPTLAPGGTRDAVIQQIEKLKKVVNNGR